ncbi:MAG: hypothetical protein ABW321_02850, partial [Polyangiales bacterium]
MSPFLQRVLVVVPWLLAALPFGCVLGLGVPATDDWQLELARVAAYGHAWADRQWPPFWAPHVYAGWGSPVFTFYGHTVVALASLGRLVLGSHARGYWAALACVSALGLWLLQRAVRRLLAAEPQPAAA